MNIDQRIKEALTPIIPEVQPDIYTGDAVEYIVWNYNLGPVLFADSTPDAARYFVQVHMYLPSGVNPIQKRIDICRAMHTAGFTYPSVTNASDKSGQHYVFECEYTDGGV